MTAWTQTMPTVPGLYYVRTVEKRLRWPDGVRVWELSEGMSWRCHGWEWPLLPESLVGLEWQPVPEALP